MRWVLLVAVLSTAACKEPVKIPPRPISVAPAPDLSPGKPDTLGPACRTVGRQVVSLTTDDGVALEADLYRTAEAGGPVALLLHMIPPHHDRTNYPTRFIDTLLLRGISVLNLDRRGAGKSKGEAREAYRGLKGWLDAKAAHDFLATHACPVDMSRLACVGASNGTTTCLDFAVQAAKDSSVTPPHALVFLTGGRYTEAQHRIADHRALLDKLPLMFVYAANERGWSFTQKKGAPKRWQFQEYRGTGHGTKIFRSRSKSITAVAKFIAEALKR